MQILNVKYTIPQKFISFRWLSIYDAAQDFSTLLIVCLVHFYFSFLASSQRMDFLHVIVQFFKQYKVNEEGKNKIRNLQTSLQKKTITETGRERKLKIISKLFNNQLKIKLNLYLFLSLMSLLQEYSKLQHPQFISYMTNR